MRRVIAVGCAVFGVVAVGGLGLLTVPIQAQQVQMDICHFGGHRSAADDIPDFKIDTVHPPFMCDNLNGNVINVSAKAASDKLRIIDELSFDKPQTKEMKSVLAALGFERSTLVVTGQPAEAVKKSVSNLEKISWMPAAYMNVLDLLNHQGLLMTEDAVRAAEALWGGERANTRRPVADRVPTDG